MVLGSLVLFTLVGCKEPVPNPELRDPIYADLKAQLAATTTDLEAQKKTLADLKASLPKLDVLSIELRQARRQIAHASKRVSELEQMKMYYEIRMEQRKAFDERDYMRAFEKDLPWPDPDEFARYKEVKSLRTASRNWDDRVPKMTRNLKAQPGASKPKQEKKAEHGSAH